MVISTDMLNVVNCSETCLNNYETILVPVWNNIKITIKGDLITIFGWQNTFLLRQDLPFWDGFPLCTKLLRVKRTEDGQALNNQFKAVQHQVLFAASSVTNDDSTELIQSSALSS